MGIIKDRYPQYNIKLLLLNGYNVDLISIKWFLIIE